MAIQGKFSGWIVEYLDQGRLRPAYALREQGDKVTVLEGKGRERSINRELILLRHPERVASGSEAEAELSRLEAERTRLRGELDLHLLWEVVREQNRSFSAAELAELFFGTRSTLATAVALEALLNDRLYFSRRHMDFVPQTAEYVERVRAQSEKARLRSESYRQTQALIREILLDHGRPAAPQVEQLVKDLRRYLDNPSTRSKELGALLAQAVPEVPEPETAYEILERLEMAPAGPRFAITGGIRLGFSEEAQREAQKIAPPPRERSDEWFAISIDDEETTEIDDALSCRAAANGGLLVRIHIALVSDFIAKGTALDREASSRAATVYLPEATVRMLPDVISCDRASLIAGQRRPVLTSEISLSAEGQILNTVIYPGTVAVGTRLNYEQADRLLEDPGDNREAANTVLMLNRMALKRRENRRRAGASLFQRRETKVRVHDGQIDIKVIENRSVTRMMVAEYMVLSNHVAARYAAEKGLPIIYRVQPNVGGDLAMQRPRLSLYPEFHAGVGLSHYAQLSSPIRRYTDLVLQRQLLAALAGQQVAAYASEELLQVLANSENSEFDGRELERRAKRYWILRYLRQQCLRSELTALALRDGASAELIDFAVRGTLRGAPANLPETQVRVRIARVDPFRGWLSLDYLRVAT